MTSNWPEGWNHVPHELRARGVETALAAITWAGEPRHELPPPIVSYYRRDGMNRPGFTCTWHGARWWLTWVSSTPTPTSSSPGTAWSICRPDTAWSPTPRVW